MLRYLYCALRLIVEVVEGAAEILIPLLRDKCLDLRRLYIVMSQLLLYQPYVSPLLQ